MDLARWQQIRSVFEEAIDLPQEERTSFLETACGDDAGLRQRVEALLAADADADAILEETPDQLASDLLEVAPTTLERIGSYRLIKTLGRGGMGDVFLGQRDDGTFKHLVALKVIRKGMDSEDILRRFRAERQILASLNHPHIAQLYDGGMTEDGRPYFAMEYLEGKPITTFCDAQQRSIKERLLLFCDVCAAVQHAHEHQIIHRDIKPSNIIVTKNGVPKLLDFGIAKVVSPDLMDLSIAMTRTGLRLMTPEYASPEQIQGRHLSLTSDVYSLGVVLYELMTGHRPYRTSGRATHDIERIVCEAEPDRLSTAVNLVEKRTKIDGTTRIISPETVSEARSTSIDGLRRLLRGDLEDIVLQAIHKDPHRRYASAGALAEDIRRYLEGRPILARHDTLIYRTQKYVRRHKIGVAIAAAILGLSIGLGSLVYNVLQPNGSVAQQEMTANARKMLVVLPFKHQGSVEQDYFSDGMADAIMAHLAGQEGLGVIARNSALQYKHTEKTIAQIGNELGVDYVLDGSIQFESPADPKGRIRVIPQLIRVADNTNLWAETYEEEASGVFDVQSSIAQQVAQALNVTLLQSQRTARNNRPTESLDAYNYYLRGNEFFLNEEDEASLFLAEKMYTQAIAHDASFAHAYAQRSQIHSALWFHHYDRSAARRDSARVDAEKALVLNPSISESYTALGLYFYRVPYNLTQALTYLDQALLLQPGTIDALRAKAWVLRRQGKLEEALTLFEQLALFDPLQADYFAVAFTQQLLRNYPDAQQAFDQAVIHDPNATVLYACMARMYLAWTGSPLEARRAFNQGTGSAINDDFTRITSIYIDLVARNYQKVLDQLTAMNQDLFNTQTFLIPAAHFRARAYRGLNNLEEAQQQEDEARQMLEAYLKDHPDDSRAYSTLGRVYASLGRPDDALLMGQRGMDLMPLQKDAVTGPLRAEDMAAIYTVTGQPNEAIDQLELLLTSPGFTSPMLLAIDPTWDALHASPRFQALIQTSN